MSRARARVCVCGVAHHGKEPGAHSGRCRSVHGTSKVKVACTRNGCSIMQRFRVPGYRTTVIGNPRWQAPAINGSLWRAAEASCRHLRGAGRGEGRPDYGPILGCLILVTGWTAPRHTRIVHNKITCTVLGYRVIATANPPPCGRTEDDALCYASHRFVKMVGTNITSPQLMGQQAQVGLLLLAGGLGIATRVASAWCTEVQLVGSLIAILCQHHQFRATPI